MKVIKIDKKYFRPNEVNNLIGDASKSKKILFWKAKTSIDTLIKEMMNHDMSMVQKNL